MSAITRAPADQRRSIESDELDVRVGAVLGQEVGPVEADAGVFADEVGAEAGAEGALDEEDVLAGGVGGGGDLTVGGVGDAGGIDDFA